MISTTYASTSVFILPYGPQFDQGVGVEVEKLNFDQAGLSNREEREPLAASLRWSMSYMAYLTAAEAATFSTAMDQWNNRPILVPFWPAMRKVSSSVAPAVIGGLTIYFEPNWSSYEVTTGGAPGGFTPSANCMRAPCMWTRFEKWPRRSVLTAADEETVDITVIEIGAPNTALDVKTTTLTNGASINGSTPPLLTVPFDRLQTDLDNDVRIERKKIGFGRDDTDTYYSHAARQHSELSFDVMGTAEVAYLIQLFKTQNGSITPFWLPNPALAGSNIYGRFYSDKLSLIWERVGYVDELVSATAEFLTLPTETSVPGGETFGTTIGPKAARCFLYLITDGTTSWRYTSYESDLVGPGSNTFTHKSMTHGRITEELNLLTHDCTLDVQHWAGGIFARLVQNPTAAPLTVTIYEGLISSPSTAAAIYTGQAMNPNVVGQQMQIKLRGAGDSILASIGPRSILQKGCNAVLGDSRCGVNVATFSYTRTLSSITGAIATLGPGAGLPPVGYFINGYAVRVVGGVTQRILIHDSYNTAGNITLVLVGPVIGAAGGESWTLVPGCDGQYSTCVSRFSNGINHRGCPNLPDKDPSMNIVNTSQGGKK